MSKKTTYRQCELVRDNVVKVAWIPSHLAVISNELRIQNSKTNEWESEWIVTFVGAERDDVPDAQQMIRRHRHATGDDLPKEKG